MVVWLRMCLGFTGVGLGFVLYWRRWCSNMSYLHSYWDWRPHVPDFVLSMTLHGNEYFEDETLAMTTMKNSSTMIHSTLLLSETNWIENLMMLDTSQCCWMVCLLVQLSVLMMQQLEPIGSLNKLNYIVVNPSTNRKPILFVYEWWHQSMSATHTLWLTLVGNNTRRLKRVSVEVYTTRVRSIRTHGYGHHHHIAGMAATADCITAIVGSGVTITITPQSPSPSVTITISGDLRRNGHFPTIGSLLSSRSGTPKVIKSSRKRFVLVISDVCSREGQYERIWGWCLLWLIRESCENKTIDKRKFHENTFIDREKKASLTIGREWRMRKRFVWRSGFMMPRRR